MAGTRKTRVPMVEQIRLINECRQSGMTDADYRYGLLSRHFCTQICSEKLLDGGV